MWLTDQEKKMLDGQAGEAVRLAEIHVTFDNMPAEAFKDARFYPLLGYAFGKQCGSRVVAISGIPKKISLDPLKGLGAAAASSGATALFHIVGVTPEAPTLTACLKGEKSCGSDRRG